MPTSARMFGVRVRFRSRYGTGTSALSACVKPLGVRMRRGDCKYALRMRRGEADTRTRGVSERGRVRAVDGASGPSAWCKVLRAKTLHWREGASSRGPALPPSTR